MSTVCKPTVRLVWSTPNPRRVIAVAARMTYSRRPVDQLQEDITEQETAASIRAVLERHHFSVLRHVALCFTVSGVSRALSHQLVRHTVGHAYEQRSQHYRVERDPAFVEPDSVAGNGHASAEYRTAVGDAEAAYARLLELGVPREDARLILPQAVETQLIWTANLEAVINFVQARACRVNVPEALSVAAAVRRLTVPLVPEVGPYLGPTCFTRGVCYEGPKYRSVCNRPWRSPTVLWTPDFPRSIELVSVDKSRDVTIVSDAVRELIDAWTEFEEGGR